MSSDDHYKLIETAFVDYIWEDVPKIIIDKFRLLYPLYYKNDDLSWMELIEYKNLPEKVKHHLNIRIEYYIDNVKNKN